MGRIRFSVNKQKPLSYADCKVPAGRTVVDGIGPDARTHLGRVREANWTWGEICEKASTEFRTDETYAQYTILKDNNFPDDWPVRPNPDKPVISAFHQAQRLKAANGFLCPSRYPSDRRASGEAYDFSLVTLDLDNPSADLFDRLRDGTTIFDQWLFVAYTTHSATKAKPKARIIIPLASTVSAPKYEALTRYLARAFDPEMKAVDRVSFRDNQLMYWPTTSQDGYWDTCEGSFGEYLDPDEFLNQFEDWENPDNWPKLPTETVVGSVTKEHPTEKRGIIGAFNRTYPIERAMDELIPGTYEPSGVSDRFTYKHGTSGDGALLRDEGYTLQTYHGSDPIAIRSNGQASSWDMVRLHKFGGLDDKARADTKIDNLPSQKAMRAYAQSLREVLSELDQVALDELTDEDVPEGDKPSQDVIQSDDEISSETTKPPVEDKYADLADILGEPIEAQDYSEFDDILGESPIAGVLPEFVTPEGEHDPLLPYRKIRIPAVITNWMERLTRDNDGIVGNTVMNVHLILSNNPMFRGCFGRMSASHMPVFTRQMKISSANVPGADRFRYIEGDPISSALTDGAYTAVKIQLQCAPAHGGYGMAKLTTNTVQDAIDLCVETNTVKPVRNWLMSLEKHPHEPMEHERALSKIFQIDDTPYTRWVSRRFFRAIIERVFEPGHIEEDVPILIGEQETGKTTFMRKMIPIAGAVFTYTGDISDSKVFMERLRDSIVCELGELASMRRAEIEAIKAAISETMYTFRPAYGHCSVNFPVSHVYYGNTNTGTPLVDRTGNRRFNPITIKGRGMDASLLGEYAKEVWAAAIADYVEARKAQPRKKFAGPDSMVMASDCLSMPMPLEVKQEAVTTRDKATSLPEDNYVAPFIRFARTPVRLGLLDPSLPKPKADTMIVREAFMVSDIADYLKVDSVRMGQTLIALLESQGYRKTEIGNGRVTLFGIRGRWYVKQGHERDKDFKGYREATPEECVSDEIQY